MTEIDWDAVDDAYDRWRDEQVADAAGDYDDLQALADEAAAASDIDRKASKENPDE